MHDKQFPFTTHKLHLHDIKIVNTLLIAEQRQYYLLK